MYRTFLTRELLPIARGRYTTRVLAVPTTNLIAERDQVTRTLKPGPVSGQPALEVQQLPGVAHWVPEQRPQAVVDWVRG